MKAERSPKIPGNESELRGFNPIGGDNMKIEERADGLHIKGYVNVTGKISRPLITPHGKCVETIEERAVIAQSQ